VTGSEIAGDPRFFARCGPFTLAVICEAAGACPVAPADRVFEAVAPLQAAGPGEISFLDNRRYGGALEATRAGAVIVHPEMAARVPSGTIAIVTDTPYIGWARVAALFHPLPPVRPGIHPSSVLEADVRVDPSAEIGPFVVIGAGAQIGARSRVGPGAVIGPGVVLGADCRIGPHATLSHVLAGNRVTVHAGARIGQEGFGFATTPTGFLSVPQLGRVILEDDVDIGANTTIDRGSARACVVVAQVGISGSTVVEDQVMLGGQAGLTGHLQIGRGARVGAQAGVMSNVAAGAEVVGSPAQPAREFFRHLAVLRRLVRQAESGRGLRS
jgi:UDP-3-O-[3-hydroxymyristoyl] glucosamine N-acyltransferase